MSTITEEHGTSDRFKGLNLQTNLKITGAIVVVSFVALVALGIAAYVTQGGIHGPGYSFREFTPLDKAFYFAPSCTFSGGLVILAYVNTIIAGQRKGPEHDHESERPHLKAKE
jgi:hypothetical protein